MYVGHATVCVAWSTKHSVRVLCALWHKRTHKVAIMTYAHAKCAEFCRVLIRQSLAHQDRFSDKGHLLVAVPRAQPGDL